MHTDRDGRTSTGRKCILIVDDEEMVRLVLGSVLSQAGYRIVEAEGGEDAVRKFGQAPGQFDLTIIDLRMPGLSGWDTLARIRQFDLRARAILISGMCTDKTDNVKAPGLRFLLKPFTNEELLRVVQEALDEPRAASGLDLPPQVFAQLLL